MVWYTKILDFFLCWAIFAFLRYCHSPLPVPESLSPLVKNLHSWELLGYQWHWIIFHVMQMPHNIYQCVAGLGWKERRHLCLWAQLLKCRTPQSLSKHIKVWENYILESTLTALETVLYLPALVVLTLIYAEMQQGNRFGIYPVSVPIGLNH